MLSAGDLVPGDETAWKEVAMKGFALDFALVALIMIAGFAVTGNLDGVMGLGFCILFGALFATVRGVVRRRARSRGLSAR